MSIKAEEALQKMKDILIGKHVKVVGVNHPHNGSTGKIVDIEYTNSGWGTKIDLDNGLSCFCFKRTDFREI